MAKKDEFIAFKITEDSFKRRWKTDIRGILSEVYDAALKSGTQPTTTNKAMFQLLCTCKHFLETVMRPSPKVKGLIRAIDETLAQQQHS